MCDGLTDLKTFVPVRFFWTAGIFSKGAKSQKNGEMRIKGGFGVRVRTRVTGQALRVQSIRCMSRVSLNGIC